MNRKQKIIVSVTGITIVLITLLGITFAYFLTKITGNTNDKSISVTTANLAIVYGNDDSSIIGEGEVIIPGKTFEPKTFTVTNKGNATTDYVVVIENVKALDAMTGELTTFNSNDFTYTLTCESGCNGSKNSVFPMNGGILVGNSIEVGETQNYSFTLKYNETGIDQSKDMNKLLEARINIKDISSINPYNDNTDSLAYNILSSAINSSNGTNLLSIPDTKPIEEVSLYKERKALDYKVVPDYFNSPGWAYGETPTYHSGTIYQECIDDMVGKYITDQTSLMNYGPVIECSEDKKPVVFIPGDTPEKTLSVIEDDYGISYYYRGNPDDNFVNFAGMCWRIVRIEGDGSIKLVLEDKNTVCNDNVDNDGDGDADYKYTGDWSLGLGNYGYTTNKVHSYLTPTENANKSMVKYFYDFQTTGKLKDYVSKLKSGNWCLENESYKIVDDKYVKMSEEETKLILGHYQEGSIYFSYLVGLNLWAEQFIGSPSLKCNGTILEKYDNNVINSQTITSNSLMYVSGLTGAEISYAGFVPESTAFSNNNSYLINDEFKKAKNGLIASDNFYTTSQTVYNPSIDDPYYDLAMTAILGNNGDLTSSDIDREMAIRPVVRLLEGTEIVKGGEGTIANPYVIN